MTKRRQPASLEAALHRAIGLLGMEEIEAATSRSAPLIRQWADPDTDTHIQARMAIAIDIACARAGEGMPMLESQRRLVEASIKSTDGPKPLERHPTLIALELQSAVGELSRVVAQDGIAGPETAPLVERLRGHLDGIEAAAAQTGPPQMTVVER